MARFLVLIGALVALFQSIAVAQQKPLRKTAPVVFATEGALYTQMQGKSYALTPGPGNWDWDPVLSPLGSYVAFLRQPQPSEQKLVLCVLRLSDGRILQLRHRLFGVNTSVLAKLTLHWEARRLVIGDGKTEAVFDLQGNKLLTRSMQRIDTPAANTAAKPTAPAVSTQTSPVQSMRHPDRAALEHAHRHQVGR